MPNCVLLIFRFWNVLLLFPAPALVMLIVLLPEPAPINVPAVAVVVVPTRLTFLTTLLVAPSAPLLWSQTTAEEAPALVFVIVRSRDAVLLLEPSIVTKSAPFRMKRALALDPEMVVPAAAGLIVTVFVAVAPGTALIVIG